MRYYLIAGEASGDLHGSNLVKELHRQDAQADIRCWGGDKMQEAGATLVKHYRHLAFMGFVEVITHLPTILKNISFCKQDISAYQPDVLVLIDYPGFNLRIAEWAHARGIKVVYYISPQVWAWKEGRVQKIKKCVDRMLVILPFEKDFYTKWQYDVTYVGHPLVEVIATEKRKNTEKISKSRVIALLPGSRSQEIKAKLPVMLEMAQYYPEHELIVAQAPSQPDALYNELIGGRKVRLVKGKTYELLKEAEAAMVTSGTATLETALFGVPEVVCYKGNAISFWLAKKLVKVKYISLVNLIMDKEVVRELIQDDLNTANLKAELDRLLYDANYRKQLQQNYTDLWQLLGEKPASAQAAAAIIEVSGGKSVSA